MLQIYNYEAFTYEIIQCLGRFQGEVEEKIFF